MNRICYYCNETHLLFFGSVELLGGELLTPGLVGDDALLNLFGCSAETRQEWI
jgi:hypothetical protein